MKVTKTAEVNGLDITAHFKDETLDALVLGKGRLRTVLVKEDVESLVKWLVKEVLGQGSQTLLKQPGVRSNGTDPSIMTKGPSLEGRMAVMSPIAKPQTVEAQRGKATEQGTVEILPGAEGPPVQFPRQ